MSRRAIANPGQRGYSRSAPAPCWNLGLALITLCLWPFVIFSFMTFVLRNPSPLACLPVGRGRGPGEGVMVLLPNIFRATSHATDTMPVGHFLNHLSCSNAKGEAAGTHSKNAAVLFTLASTRLLCGSSFYLLGSYLPLKSSVPGQFNN